jgi:peptidoglycan/LPS O-acetylase OafA/YrhL
METFFITLAVIALSGLCFWLFVIEPRRKIGRRFASSPQRKTVPSVFRLIHRSPSVQVASVVFYSRHDCSKLLAVENKCRGLF